MGRGVEENIPEGQRTKTIPFTWIHGIFSNVLLPFRAMTEGLQHAMPVWPSREHKQTCPAPVAGIFCGQPLHPGRLMTQQRPCNAPPVSLSLLPTLNVIYFSSPARGIPTDRPQASNWIPRSLPEVTFAMVTYLPLIVIDQIWLQAEFWPSGLHDMTIMLSIKNHTVQILKTILTAHMIGSAGPVWLPPATFSYYLPPPQKILKIKGLWSETNTMISFRR